MRVLVADDHVLVRQGFVSFLGSSEASWELDEAVDLYEASEKLTDNKTDILSIDLHMPGMAGISSLESLREQHPDLKIVVMTATEDRQLILACLRIGVNGYIPKSLPSDELLRAVRTIAEGGIYVPTALMRKEAIADPVETRQLPDGVASTLTPRQREVMDLLAQGLSTKMIARRLSLGVGTVKVHLAALYRSLNVHTRTEAVIRSASLPLTEDGPSTA